MTRKAKVAVAIMVVSAILLGLYWSGWLMPILEAVLWTAVR